MSSNTGVRRGIGLLLLLASGEVLAHTLVNHRYGFFRDELGTLGDALHLAWGYVSYPPLAPFVARIALELFGPSLVGLRLFAALAHGAAMVLAGLMARELGGGRRAEVVAALAVGIAPVAVATSSLYEYVSFDYLWWVLAAYSTIRLLRPGGERRPGPERWWLGIGLALGLGMMTRYTIAFFAAGLLGGLLLTPARRLLLSRWLWLGAALGLLLWLPNLWWQARHDFLSLEFLRSIHARDIRIGRTDGFWWKQAILGASLFTIPLCVAGLRFYFLKPEGRDFRALGWVFVLVLGLFAVARGRDYYMAPAYPILLVAGAVAAEQWSRVARGLTWAALAGGAALSAAFAMPLAPVNSAWWNIMDKNNGDMREEIGWPELVEAVAQVRDSLPAEERAQAVILAGNYGEAGAVDLLGPRFGLPRAISGINSYWLRGFGDPPPDTLVVIGLNRAALDRDFESCEVAGHIANRYGVRNEETLYHPDIFVCRRARLPWPELWARLKSFG
ncbi:MAG TPA: glycosyltransferase family 39 protein [Bryobacteraceae bacterium]|nr:glycosyltransferase family 39 protein [Bryobacteraceae bacterium]